MHQDPNLRKRNALVIPGGLLTLVSLVGMAYVVLLRGDQGTCEDAGLIVLAGACRSALLVLAIPLVIGLAMAASGAMAFRSKATCRLGWGSWAHFGLALLITLVVLPLLAMLLAPSLVGEDAAVSRGGVNYPISSILAGLAGVGFVALLPFLGLYVARGRANPCCHEKGCFEPCFCDEPVAASEDAIPPPPESGPLEDPVLATAAPVEPAPGPVPESQAPAVPEPAPLPATGAAAPARQEWGATPAEPAESWEVLPEEEPAAEPEPALEPAPQPRQAAAPPPAAPALATRPTDPAAPPQDAMAVAAKWAEEDEAALKELEGDEGAGATKGSRKSRLAKKDADPKKKTLSQAPAKAGKAPRRPPSAPPKPAAKAAKPSRPPPRKKAKR